MKVVHINTFPYKATGTIMLSIHHALQKAGYDSYVIWGRGRKPENNNEISIEDSVEIKLHGLYTRITDRTGFASAKATKKLLEALDNIRPDIIHLHNLHGYYINIEMLFYYIRQHNIKIYWTLHDCWSFTGHCAYFDAVGCERWKTGCHNCPQKSSYPASMFMDASSWNWKRKKELFTGLDITLITPCNWLKGLVKQSFLAEYPVEVIYNGIDTQKFKPTQSTFRKIYNIENKIIILGVASEWTARKGLDDFVKLDKILSEKIPNQYKVVIVGLKENQIDKMPHNILSLKRTSSLEKLIEIYSAADIFFNPTYEDNYPTTNIEAICCGTPVVTYNTGGSPESIDENTGIVLEKGDVHKMAEIVCQRSYNKIRKKIDFLHIQEKFDQNKMIQQYLKLYINYLG